MADGDTVTLPRRDAAADATERAQLVIAFTCDRPTTAPSSRHILDGVDHVELGRGKRTEAARATKAGRVHLDLRIADPSMSEHHAKLTRLRGRWLLEDLGSKNGCVINGRVSKRSHLVDGDVVEVGNTFAIFRDGAVPLDGADDIFADKLAPPFANVPTFSGDLATQLASAKAIAPSLVPVLITGDTGTGKEVVSRAIHAASARRGAFVAVNCGALPPTLVEAELFGHRRGAFSGAVEDRPGHVRAADHGTLLLDEIGDLPLPAQATLLRVLQEREVVPIGESLPVRVDVRVIAATHVDLEARVATGQFRRDLLARLTGLVIELPTLAERREDLGILVAALLPASSTLSSLAARALLHHDWPDNVRELGMVLQAAAALAGASPIDLPHLPRAFRQPIQVPGEDASPSELSADDVALRERLVASLAEHAGNVSAVARALGKARWQIHRWMRRFALDTEAYRK